MSKSYEEWLKYYENATKEQVIEDMTHDFEEIERLKNIIKEVREYIEENTRTGGINKDKKYFKLPSQAMNILEILDKGE